MNIHEARSRRARQSVRGRAALGNSLENPIASCVLCRPIRGHRADPTRGSPSDFLIRVASVRKTRAIN